VKLIRDKQTGQLQGYGFVEFVSHAAAERVLTTFNGQMMPNVEMAYRLNWASAGEKRDDSPDYTIFVGDLAADVTDYTLQETFRVHYPSVKGAKVVTDKMTMRSKGYGFVKFGDPAEQARAMTEMNGMPCSSRPMRIGPAANRKTTGAQERGKSRQSHVPTIVMSYHIHVVTSYWYLITMRVAAFTFCDFLSCLLVFVRTNLY
jgi:RNA recognition motif-containing protein